MKYACCLLFLFSLANKINAQQENAVTKVFIVRHAEKESGKDPVLTPAGILRAGDLMRALKDEGVQKIYVSQYKRTQMTADSMRIQLGIDTVHYMADTACDNLVNAIMEHRDFGKTILIVAHSNTIPHIIRKLGVSDFPRGDLPDGEFDNLFMITYKKEKAKIKLAKYGAKPSASAPMQ
ncbi:MAG TPA: histidine phosphatase family protein [Ferruginibacter sp.]|nr:histidine phosphatase family protein [Ferruginibacter sp.]